MEVRSLQDMEADEVTISFDPRVRYYLWLDALRVSTMSRRLPKEPGHRIKEPHGPNGTCEGHRHLVVAVNNYRATTQLLTAADIFLPGEELPKLLEIDVRGDGRHPRAAAICIRVS